MGKVCSPPAGAVLCAGLCAQSRRPPAGLWWGGGAASSVRPFLGRRGAHGCSLRGPRRPLLAGGPPSRSIDGLTPANARKTGRLRSGGRPGQRKSLPSLPRGKEIALTGRGEPPPSPSGSLRLPPHRSFLGEKANCGAEKGEMDFDWEEGGLYPPALFSGEGQHAAALNEWGRAAPSPLEGPRPPLCRGAPIAAP